MKMRPDTRNENIDTTGTAAEITAEELRAAAEYLRTLRHEAEERQRHQDERQPTPRPKCNICGGKMQRLYIHQYEPTGSGKPRRNWIGIGWICENPKCNNIIRDE